MRHSHSEAGGGGGRVASGDLRQAQPDVASPAAISATVARKVETSLASCPARVFVVAFMETSVHVLAVREELIIQLLAKKQPKASANSNAEPGNAGLSLPRRSYRLPALGCRSHGGMIARSGEHQDRQRLAHLSAQPVSLGRAYPWALASHAEPVAGRSAAVGGPQASPPGRSP
jgi:hypothetical protein